MKENQAKEGGPERSFVNWDWNDEKEKEGVGGKDHGKW